MAYNERSWSVCQRAVVPEPMLLNQEFLSHHPVSMSARRKAYGLTGSSTLNLWVQGLGKQRHFRALLVC